MCGLLRSFFSNFEMFDRWTSGLDVRQIFLLRRGALRKWFVDVLSPVKVDVP